MDLFNFFRRKGKEDEKIAEFAASAIAKGGVEGLSDYVFGRAEYESKLIAETIAMVFAGKFRPSPPRRSPRSRFRGSVPG